jgi:outer membrane autotransporter protein
MEKQPTVAAAVTSIGTANEFERGWSDLLPGNDAAVLKLLSANATAAFGATAHRLDLISDKPDAPGGAWVEEFGVYHEADGTADSLPVSGGGFGVAAGIDLISTGDALIGAFAAIESVEVDERERTAAPLNVAHTTLGAYGGLRAGNFALNAAAGYGFIDFTSEREVAAGGLVDTLRGEWNGQSYNVGARATYNIPLGFLDVEPFVAADYVGFTEDGYTETAEIFDELILTAEEGEATLATASYGLYLSGNFGSDDAFSFRPEASFGYRNVLSWDAPSTTYRFAGAGATAIPFTLDPGQVEDGFVAGLGLNVESQFLNIKFAYDAGFSDTSTTHYGSITLRMAFW